METGDQGLNAMKKLLARANHPSNQIRLRDWERVIEWRVDNQVYQWRVGDGGVALMEGQLPHMVLTGSLEVVQRIAAGELPLFISIWATGDLQYQGDFADAFRLGYLFLTDQRGRRVVFVAHCFLNTNTRFPGGCAYPGATEPLVEYLLHSGYGIVQMPCPEFLCLGLEKEQYGLIPETELRAGFKQLAQSVVDQVQAYLDHGFQVAGIIGMNPSPSCGVEVTKGKGTMLGIDRELGERGGPGVFSEELLGCLAAAGLAEAVPVFGFRRILPGEAGLSERMAGLAEKLRG